ncbi:MAG: imidazoleglycerol-phosphate dehydratase, partial [Planctomycetota bacterium]
MVSISNHDMRTAQLDRKTGETQVSVAINLDGEGSGDRHSGVGFLDHMLDLFARHSLIDLDVAATGDLEVDDHHTTEDVGIVIGTCLDQALGDRAGIRRYGHFTLPMDECLVTSAVDMGSRYAFEFDAPIAATKIGTFDSELVEHFWQSLAVNARCNLHVILHRGTNAH